MRHLVVRGYGEQATGGGDWLLYLGAWDILSMPNGIYGDRERSRGEDGQWHTKMAIRTFRRRSRCTRPSGW